MSHLQPAVVDSTSVETTGKSKGKGKGGKGKGKGKGGKGKCMMAGIITTKSPLNFLRNATSPDGPITVLLADLKARDLLKDTLVIWGGEFGRAPTATGTGRGYNSKGYTTWMAGGGVKGGMHYGATDEHGYAAVVDKMHFHDWHDTILALLGLNH